jgi:hypothetical protein
VAEATSREKVMLKIPLSSRWVVFKLSFSCWLWDLRGLPICPYHGFVHQSWWNGFCRECGEIPVIPPMEDSCIMCGEEKAVLQRASPNGDKEIWSLCWECDRFIDWSELNAMHMMVGEDYPDFDEWLFKTEQVYPKHEWSTMVLKKKGVA